MATTRTTTSPREQIPVEYIFSLFLSLVCSLVIFLLILRFSSSRKIPSVKPIVSAHWAIVYFDIPFSPALIFFRSLKERSSKRSVDIFSPRNEFYLSWKLRHFLLNLWMKAVECVDVSGLFESSSRRFIFWCEEVKREGKQSKEKMKVRKRLKIQSSYFTVHSTRWRRKATRITERDHKEVSRDSLGRKSQSLNQRKKRDSVHCCIKTSIYRQHPMFVINTDSSLPLGF